MPLEQPPPDAPAPPPGPAALRSRRIMWKIMMLGCGSIVVLLLSGFLAPFVLRSRKAPDRTEAIWNLKQISLSLDEFEESYGQLPDESTAGRVKADTGTALQLIGSSSNALFRQLLARGLKSEKPFYCKSAHTHRPDDVFYDDAHALAPGECGFAYVAGVSHDADPHTPIAMAPMIPGTRRFDSSIHDGKAVVLFRDGTAMPLTINSAGQTVLNGMDLFDPRQPFWHGKVPDLRLPE